MSRAFVKEDAGDEDLPERPQSASPNYVTPAGLEALRLRVSELKRRSAAVDKDSSEGRALGRELRYVEGRLARAILVDARGRATDEVRFGATVVLENSSGTRRSITIVGQDEADAAAGKLSWDSPDALTLMGARVGVTVELTAGPSRVTSIAYQ